MELTNPFVEIRKEETEQSIPDRFEEIVRRHTQSIAIKAGDITCDYTGLNKSANRIARAISALSGAEHDPVARYLNLDVSMISSILGVLKPRKICVPLDPSYPQERAS